MSFVDRLPEDRVRMLTGMSLTPARDLEQLQTLADYCIRDDTGGVVAREMARVFIPDGARRYRLARAGFLHDRDEARECGCGVPTLPGCWSLHRPVIDAAAW